jgi:hypothetical protein
MDLKFTNPLPQMMAEWLRSYLLIDLSLHTNHRDVLAFSLLSQQTAKDCHYNYLILIFQLNIFTNQWTRARAL